MKIVKRIVDPTTFNLEFYDTIDPVNGVRQYLGTLKFSRTDAAHNDFVGALRDGELGEMVGIDYEEIQYLQMTRVE